MKRCLCLFTALIVVILAMGAGPPEQTRFEAYSIDFADPQAAEAMATAIVGDFGSVVLDPSTHRLLVVTTAERHLKLADMMQKLNIVPRNVRIDVRFSGGGVEHESEASISGGGEIIHEDGFTRGTIKIEPRVINQTITSSDDVTQTLLVASGREGFLQVGESVPYLEWLVDYGLQWGYLQQRVQWQDVGSRLVVAPMIVGEGPTIRIRLTPELTGMVNGRPMQMRYARVATEVVVQDGQTFQIGGLDQDQEFYSRFLVGRSRSGSQQTLDISLTPRIIDATRAP